MFDTLQSVTGFIPRPGAKHKENRVVNAVNPKIIKIADYLTPKAQFSHPSQNGGKMPPDGDSGKIPETPQNMGVPALSDTPLEGNSVKRVRPARAGK